MNLNDLTEKDIGKFYKRPEWYDTSYIQMIGIKKFRMMWTKIKGEYNIPFPAVHDYYECNNKGEDLSASEKKANWARKIKEENKRCYYKFDINDKGWFMDGHKIRREPVNQIIRVTGDIQDKYNVAGLWRYEDELFQTKQALTNSLFIEYEEYYDKGEKREKENNI